MAGIDPTSKRTIYESDDDDIGWGEYIATKAKDYVWDSLIETIFGSGESRRDNQQLGTFEIYLPILFKTCVVLLGVILVYSLLLKFGLIAYVCFFWNGKSTKKRQYKKRGMDVDYNEDEYEDEGEDDY